MVNRRRTTNHFETNWPGSDGLNLYAQGWEPDAPPKAVVCLVHGLGEHSGRYAHVGMVLTQAGCALLGFDLRGHGKSEGPRGHAPSWEVLFSDVDCLLDQAAERYPGKGRFLYGHSLGGSIVLSYALRCKPKLLGVIATSPGLRTAFEPPRWKLTIGRVLYKVRPQLAMANGLDREGLSHDPAVVRAYNSDPLVHDRVTARLALDMFAAGEEALAQANRFPLPLLLMHGNSDGLTSFRASREFADAAPASKCTFKEWDGLYHELHNEPQQAEVFATMIGWLDAHMPAKSAPPAAPAHPYGPLKSAPKKKKKR